MTITTWTRRHLIPVLTGLVGALFFGLMATASEPPSESGSPSVQTDTPMTDSIVAPSAEAEHLLRMRHEEKLARDVYLALARRHDDGTFERIAAAEQRHMNAVRQMLVRLDLDDPITDDQPGVFTDPEFKALYAMLVKTGSESLAKALQVGARIEEMDIVDLRHARAKTNRADLRGVYDNLERASRNHLRAFAGRLKATGHSYEARHLTQKEFDAIAAAPMERGRGHGAGRGQRRGR